MARLISLILTLADFTLVRLHCQSAGRAPRNLLQKAPGKPFCAQRTDKPVFVPRAGLLPGLGWWNMPHDAV
jgi:hypothetical protein